MMSRHTAKNLRGIFLGGVVFLFLVFSAPVTTQAQESTPGETEELLEQIRQLLETIATLQEQNVSLDSEAGLSDTLFTVDMSKGDENPLVRNVQQLLNNDVRTAVATSGPGSPGNESDYFGSLTEDAVIRFQELYSEEILAPNDLVAGNGYVGPSTRAKMNSLSSDTLADNTPVAVLPVKETKLTSQVSVTRTLKKGSKSNRSVSATSITENESSSTTPTSEDTASVTPIPENTSSTTPTSEEEIASTTPPIAEEPSSIDPDNYTLTRISTTGNEDTPDNSNPLDITLDDDGNPWVTGEFQWNIINIDKETNSANIYPLPEAGPIFGWVNNSIVSMSNLAEDITKDSSGNIWITQGGAYVEFTGEHNHSRVISINPTTKEMTAYNVVENHSSATGIMYDEDINKIYFTEAGLFNNQPKLVSFTPGSIDTSIGFDNQAGLDALNCVGADNRDNCYFVEDIPWRGPARLVKGLDDNIYFTGPYDNYLGQYNPETRDFKKFNLPKPRKNPAPSLVTSFPWDIEVDRSTGDILLTEYVDSQIIRFQTNKESNDECQIEKVSADDSIEHRGSAGLENCVIEYNALPQSELNKTQSVMTHSLDIDDLGNVWFTTSNYVGVIPAGESIAKFRKIEGTSLNIPEGSDLTDHMTGIRVDNNTGDIWINSFTSQEVYRLQRDF